MLNRRRALQITAFGAAAILTGKARAQSPLVLKLAHDSPVTSPWHIGSLKMADFVKEKSAGALQIRVYPSAQLGDLRELGELTKAGTVDMALLTAGAAANFVPSMNVFGLPFLFSNSDQAAKVYSGPLTRDLMNDAAAAGYKGLGLNCLSFRSPMNRRGPIADISGLKGLKIRLQQVPIHLDTYSALGASPVALPYSEVYTAAQSGVIDGVENSPAGVHGPKFHEVMKFYSELPVFINACVMLMGARKFGDLSPANKAIMEEASVKGNGWINEEFVKVDASALNGMKAAGVKIESGPFDLAPWRKAVQPVYDKYVPTLPASARKVVAELKTW